MGTNNALESQKVLRLPTAFNPVHRTPKRRSSLPIFFTSTRGLRFKTDLMRRHPRPDADDTQHVGFAGAFRDVVLKIGVVNPRKADAAMADDSDDLRRCQHCR